MEYGSDTRALMPSDARNWAMFCHLAALIGFLGNGIGLIAGPLVVWLIKREDHPFIDEQGKEALNFQITMLIAFFVSGILVFVGIGLLLLLVLGLAELILPIIAGIKAKDGVHYRYPLTLRLID